MRSRHGSALVLCMVLLMTYGVGLSEEKKSEMLTAIQNSAFEEAIPPERQEKLDLALKKLYQQKRGIRLILTYTEPNWWNLIRSVTTGVYIAHERPEKLDRYIADVQYLMREYANAGSAERKTMFMTNRYGPFLRDQNIPSLPDEYYMPPPNQLRGLITIAATIMNVRQAAGDSHYYTALSYPEFELFDVVQKGNFRNKTPDYAKQLMLTVRDEIFDMAISEQTGQYLDSYLSK